MHDVAISVEGIGKAYHIGIKEAIHDTFGGAVTSWVKAPLRNFRNLRRLNTYAFDTEGDNIFWALRDVSFNVNRGEVIGVIGRNGAGKSTMLKVLSRITEPTRGRIKIDGRVASLLEVGTGFHPELTGRENVFLNGTILGMSRGEIARSFDAIVDFSGVHKFIDTPVKRYSSGMYVRLAFAVAAHLEPEILIVDEVLAVGDQEFQDKCLGKMRAVSRSGRTVLFVSHNMASIKALCSRCLYMRNGRVVSDGAPGEIIDEYLASSVRVSEDGRVPEGVDRMQTGQAHFTHAFVVGDQGLPTAEVPYGAPICVRMRLEVLEPLRNVLLDVRLCSEGMEITHSMLTHIDGERLSLAPGTYELEARLDNMLQPGRYLLNPGVHFTNGSTIDYIENALDVRVLPVARDGGGWTYPWIVGRVRLAADWDIRETEPAVLT